MLDFLHEVALLSDREKDAETPEVTLMMKRPLSEW
jgi:hypothetical protein